MGILPQITPNIWVVFPVSLVCEKELNLNIKQVNKTSKVNTHDNNENERVLNTHSKGEQVRIPLLPNRVGKRSETMTMVRTWANCNIYVWVKSGQTGVSIVDFKK